MGNETAPPGVRHLHLHGIMWQKGNAKTLINARDLKQTMHRNVIF